MKKRILISSLVILMIFMALTILMAGYASAITGSIGNAKIVVNATLGETIIRSILVKNVNDVPVYIMASASGDLEDSIGILNEEFILSPQEEKKVFFIVKPTETGTTETKINIAFVPEEGEEVGLSSRVTINIQANKQESRISSLESWKQTIDDWRDQIVSLLSDINTEMSGLVTRINDQEDRLDDLENKDCACEENPADFTNYFKYLSSGDRKNAVCGYAEDHKLKTITDLGYNCTITYRTSSSGRVSSSCRCSKIG
jgi:hypothetical protein